MQDAPALFSSGPLSVSPQLAGIYHPRSHTEAIWQSDRRVMRLTTKVVCNLEPSL